MSVEPSRRDIVVIGASTGGFEALKGIVAGLSPDLNASILVVVHVAANSPGVLPQLLRACGSLPVANATDGEEITPGRIYVAPADDHLVVDSGGFVRLSRGPKENYFRPAIDPLFRSAAVSFGSRVIGVILTGGLDDGTSGLWAVKQRGGVAIVQEPEEAVAPSMPRNALKHVSVNYCIPLAQIAPLLNELVETSAVTAQQAPTREMELEVSVAMGNPPLESGIMSWGTISEVTCPECSGILLHRTDAVTSTA